MARLAEGSQKWRDVPFVEGATIPIDLPKDRVLKHIKLRLSGSVVTTFASGSPAAPRESTFDVLVKRLEVVVGGDNTIKSVRPHMMKMQELLAYQQESERKGSAAAAAAVGLNPTVDGGFVFGTTTQTSSFAESLFISFENVLCDKGMEQTWLDLRGVPSAELKITCGTFALLDTTGAPVTYSAANVTISIYLIESGDLPRGFPLSTWMQRTRTEPFTGQITDKVFDLKSNNRLQGIGFYVVNGASPSVPVDLGLVEIRLKANGGREIIKSTDFLDLQDDMRKRFGVVAPRVSNVSRMDGYAYLDLLDAGVLGTALDTSKYDTVTLEVSTRAAGAPVTYPLTVTMQTDEIILPMAK